MTAFLAGADGVRWDGASNCSDGPEDNRRDAGSTLAAVFQAAVVFGLRGVFHGIAGVSSSMKQWNANWEHWRCDASKL